MREEGPVLQFWAGQKLESFLLSAQRTGTAMRLVLFKIISVGQWSQSQDFSCLCGPHAQHLHLCQVQRSIWEKQPLIHASAH